MWHSTHSLLILTCFSQRAFPTRENAQSDHARVAIYFAMQQEKKWSHPPHETCRNHEIVFWEVLIVFFAGGVVCLFVH